MSISIEDVKDKIKSKNVPIVILDARWHQLFPEKEKTPEIKKLEKSLRDLMQLQGKVTNDLKEARKLKAKFMESVINVAEDSSLSDSKKQKMQEKNQKLIIEARDKIEELEDMELELPRRIREANMALVVESVNVCYKKINKNRRDIAALTKWIDEMRVELKKRILIKQDKETKNTNIYTYMHDLLGAELMEVFDENSN